MPAKSNTLFFFTAEYPYGSKSETFIETEIHYLSKAFDSIIIYPLSKGDGSIRSLPKNVTVDDSIHKLNFSKKNKTKSLLKNLGTTLKVWKSERSDKGLGTALKNRKSLLDYLAQQLIIHDFLSKQNLKNGIVYDYWFINATLALSILRRKNFISKLIVRGHRFDIYDDCHPDKGVPFRKWKIENIDRFCVISQYGIDYVKSKINPHHSNKLKLTYLGVQKHESSTQKQAVSDKKTIVSCSSMIPFKQVDKIPELLAQIDTPLHWIHFGDGNERTKVESAISSLPEHISVDLKGHCANTDVINFYKNNQVDLFLSLSTSEGLPVSMMEAQSFGIPILANPVCGIPEIVIDSKTGFLFSKEYDKTLAAELLSKTIEFDFSELEIISFFKSRFDSSKNYVKFANELKTL